MFKPAFKASSISRTQPLVAQWIHSSLQTTPGRLQDKVAVVTGASSGIGRAIALAYSAQGAHVVCADIRDTTKFDKSDDETRGTTHDRIKENGGKAIFVQTDVTKEESVENVVQAAVKEFGRLDVIVNNAGIAFESASPVRLTDG